MTTGAALTPDTLVMVRAGWHSHFGGNVRFADLRELAWRSSSGEIRARGQTSRLSARMWCTALLTGGLDVERCQHAPGEHEVLVYIVSGDQPELYEQLVAAAVAIQLKTSEGNT
jgi:hypothetical protein